MQTIEVTVKQNWELLRSAFDVVIIDARDLIHHHIQYQNRFLLYSLGVTLKTEIIIIDKIICKEDFKMIQNLIPFSGGRIRIEEKGSEASYISPMILFTWFTNSNAPA